MTRKIMTVALAAALTIFAPGLGCWQALAGMVEGNAEARQPIDAASLETPLDATAQQTEQFLDQGAFNAAEVETLPDLASDRAQAQADRLELDSNELSVVNTQPMATQGSFARLSQKVSASHAKALAKLAEFRQNLAAKWADSVDQYRQGLDVIFNGASLQPDYAFARQGQVRASQGLEKPFHSGLSLAKSDAQPSTGGTGAGAPSSTAPAAPAATQETTSYARKAKFANAARRFIRVLLGAYPRLMMHKDLARQLVDEKKWFMTPLNSGMQTPIIDAVKYLAEIGDHESIPRLKALFEDYSDRRFKASTGNSYAWGDFNVTTSYGPADYVPGQVLGETIKALLQLLPNAEAEAFVAQTLNNRIFSLSDSNMKALLDFAVKHEMRSLAPSLLKSAQHFHNDGNGSFGGSHEDFYKSQDLADAAYRLSEDPAVKASALKILVDIYASSESNRRTYAKNLLTDILRAPKDKDLMVTTADDPNTIEISFGEQDFKASGLSGRIIRLRRGQTLNFVLDGVQVYELTGPTVNGLPAEGSPLGISSYGFGGALIIDMSELSPKYGYDVAPTKDAAAGAYLVRFPLNPDPWFGRNASRAFSFIVEVVN